MRPRWGSTPRRTDWLTVSFSWLWLELWLIWFWIDDRIYWTLWYRAWLHFTVHCYTHTSVHIYVFTSRCLTAASNGGRSPSSVFPSCPRPQLPASYSNSSEQLNPSGYLTHYQLLLYSCLFRCRCLATGLHATELIHLFLAITIEPVELGMRTLVLGKKVKKVKFSLCLTN
jgi:hypothetical protein